MATITTDNATERVGRTVNGSTKKYADEKSRAEINKIFTDGAYAGQGYTSCSTDAKTAAKTVTIANFLLLKNVPVHILFTKAVDVANATLNISSTGAKPIYYLGTPIQSGVIRPNTIVTLVYDGTNYNVVGIAGLEESSDPSDLWVDMGLPSGLKWAKKNIDVTQANGFAASEFQYECSFFSWGNKEGYNPISNSAFDHDWGSANDGVYADTPGAQLTGNEPASMDAARVNLGAPWRKPTTAEYQELFDNCDFINADGSAIDATQTNKLVTVNGIVGIYLKSKINGNRIFFPCSGYGYGTTWGDRGSHGHYWSGSLYSATSGRRLYFNSGGVYPQSNTYRFHGFAVRAVQ